MNTKHMLALADLRYWARSFGAAARAGGAGPDLEMLESDLQRAVRRCERLGLSHNQVADIVEAEAASLAGEVA